MIYWVFGGTAVGKKRFIARALDPDTRPAWLTFQRPVIAVWLEDGPLTVDLAELELRYDVLVRWQWGREEWIIEFCSPTQAHTLLCLSTGLMTQLSRIALREGCLKWDAESLHGEMRRIYECVAKLAARYALPVLYVDTSSSEGYNLR